jgi:ChrR Cupin-like domain
MRRPAKFFPSDHGARFFSLGDGARLRLRYALETSDAAAKLMESVASKFTFTAVTASCKTRADQKMSINEKPTSYALGALTLTERRSVDCERLYNRDLDQEVEKVEAMLVKLNADQEKTVRDGLWSDILCAVEREQLQLGGKTVSPCSSGDWEIHGPGIESKQLWSPKAMLIRCIPGAYEDAHAQPDDDDEHIVVLAGDLLIGGRSFGTGDYICVPAGSLHSTMSTSGGCIIFTEYSVATHQFAAAYPP